MQSQKQLERDVSYVFEQDMAHVYRLRLEIKAMEQEVKDILGRHTFSAAETVATPDYLVKIARTVRFDPATAEANLTQEELAATLVTKPDSARAKQVLSPERYARTQREFGWEVRVTPVGE